MYVVLCLLLFGGQYQCNWLTGKTRLRNDLLCVEWDVKPYYYYYYYYFSPLFCHMFMAAGFIKLLSSSDDCNDCISLGSLNLTWSMWLRRAENHGRWNSAKLVIGWWRYFSLCDCSETTKQVQFGTRMIPAYFMLIFFQFPVDIKSRFNTSLDAWYYNIQHTTALFYYQLLSVTIWSK